MLFIIKDTIGYFYKLLGYICIIGYVATYFSFLLFSEYHSFKDLTLATVRGSKIRIDIAYMLLIVFMMSMLHFIYRSFTLFLNRLIIKCVCFPLNMTRCAAYKRTSLRYKLIHFNKTQGLHHKTQKSVYFNISVVLCSPVVR